ncbi:hypothetical protein MMPV_000019 [Pyropia vietnamensis]
MSVTALFSSLSVDERRFMLAPPGTVAPRLSPTALAAAAVWTTRETGSAATLETLCPGGDFGVSPGQLPGEACNIDMSHLLVPFSTLNGRTIGHASTLTRLFCTPGSRPSGSAWQPPVFGSHGGPPPNANAGPGAVSMNGRFMYDEDAQHLLLRTTLGGNPVWMGYAFRTKHHDVLTSSSDDIALTSERGDEAGEEDDWEAARADATTRAKSVTDAIVEAARQCGFASVDRVRSITLYVPGAELSAEGVAKHVMIKDERLTSRWGEEDGRNAEWGVALVDDSGADKDLDDHVTDASSESAGSSSLVGPVGPSTEWADISCSSSDFSGASNESSAASVMTVMSEVGATSRGHAPRSIKWQRDGRAGDGVGASDHLRRRRRRPRTSVIDFTNFAASLSANITGVYQHCMPPSWPGILNSYYGSEGVVPASTALMPFFRGTAGTQAAERGAVAVSGAAWGIIGGGEARLDGLLAAFSSLALTTTPLVRDAERLLALPLPAAGVTSEQRGERGDDEKRPLFPRDAAEVLSAARCRRAASGSVHATGGRALATGVATAADATDASYTVSASPTDTSGSVPSSAAVGPFVALFDGDGDSDGVVSSLPSTDAVKAFDSLF